MIKTLSKIYQFSGKMQVLDSCYALGNADATGFGTVDGDRGGVVQIE